MENLPSTDSSSEELAFMLAYLSGLRASSQKRRRLTKCHKNPTLSELVVSRARESKGRRLASRIPSGTPEDCGWCQVFARGLRRFFNYFLTTTSSSPDSSFTLAVPHVVGFPAVSNRQPKSPAFFSPHCPAFTATTNHPDPTGRPPGFPWA